MRLLFIADTHLGFDLPTRPRVERRRRGHDFFANFDRALQPALDGEADVVVHGGDLLYRSRVPASLVQRAFQPLKRVADSGVPVVLVPGNHERSKVPFSMLGIHERIHIFHRPGTFVLEADGARIALAGFPCCRDDARRRFPQLLETTGWRDTSADVNVLCVHQCFEGATVGPSDYTFRTAGDVVRVRDVPAEFAAVLAGHIHRHQVLSADLRGRSIPTPVFYPGSIERTSFAEKDEPKGYLMLELEPGDSPGGIVTHWEFRTLPARPMVSVDLLLDGTDSVEIEALIRREIEAAPADAVLGIRVRGTPTSVPIRLPSAARMRELAPETMNVDVRVVSSTER